MKAELCVIHISRADDCFTVLVGREREIKGKRKGKTLRESDRHTHVHTNKIKQERKGRKKDRKRKGKSVPSRKKK